jgi:hypothetical protein
MKESTGGEMIVKYFTLINRTDDDNTDIMRVVDSVFENSEVTDTLGNDRDFSARCLLTSLMAYNYYYMLEEEHTFEMVSLLCCAGDAPADSSGVTYREYSYLDSLIDKVRETVSEDDTRYIIVKNYDEYHSGSPDELMKIRTYLDCVVKRFLIQYESD